MNVNNKPTMLLIVLTFPKEYKLPSNLLKDHAIKAESILKLIHKKP